MPERFRAEIVGKPSGGYPHGPEISRNPAVRTGRSPAGRGFGRKISRTILPVGILKDFRTAAGTVPELTDRLDDLDYRIERAGNLAAVAVVVGLVLLAAIAVGVNRGR